MTLAPRSAATCDAGSGTGGHASAFRTASGLRPRPVVGLVAVGATVFQILHRRGFSRPLGALENHGYYITSD